ncbi:MAG TPA: enoyl-CoA hydratase/isomerase family protein [Ideonella sp.]|nr:enoyl-CoA hydratase/isomerase family protein [Ideonella sp.]
MILTERRGGTLVATLARPPVNAIDDRLLARLDTVIDEALADEGVAVLHLRSAHRTFCAGADLALMRDCLAGPAGAEAMVALVREMQRLFARLEAAPFVTLAEIGGAAYGGGLELALACDLRVASHDAKLALPEVGLGLLPAAGGTQRLTALVGPSVARRLILGGEAIDGAEAERLGLVQWSRPAAELAAWTAALAARLATYPRAALAANKRCVALAEGGFDAGYAEEIAATRALYADPQTLQRVSAFLNRKH